MVIADRMLDGIDRQLLARQTREQDALMIEGAETIRETAWNLCKQFDATTVQRNRVLLTNYVSTGLERRFGEEIENLYREDWLMEVDLFCHKYGYAEDQ